MTHNTQLTLKRSKVLAACMFFCLCSCRDNAVSNEQPGNHATAMPQKSDSFKTVSPARDPVKDLELELKLGQKDCPVKIVSSVINTKGEVLVHYTNVSSNDIDVVRVVLFGFDDLGASQNFENGLPYLYTTDQRAIKPMKSGTILYPLQHKGMSTIRAYAVKVHYASGGSWENN